MMGMRRPQPFRSGLLAQTLQRFLCDIFVIVEAHRVCLHRHDFIGNEFRHTLAQIFQLG
jgi:hypothetical protein